MREKIPVIIFDTGVDTDLYTSHIATDNYGAGVMAARRMGQILDGKGNIVIVAVQPGIASTMAREQGFEETIKKEFPGIQIVDKRYGMTDFAKSLQVAENMLTAHPDARRHCSPPTNPARWARRRRSSRARARSRWWGSTGARRWRRT